MELSLTQRDQQVIWHPYTQHKTMLPPIPVTHACGALLYDEKGKSYIDAISSWWVNIHGHAHPYIAEKIFEQAKKLEHVIFTGFTHEPAVQLAERLLARLPGNFSRIFYSDNGSTAVEVAIKMAIQYRKNAPDVRSPSSGARKKILALKHSYHGDTFGAMSVSERSVFTLPFAEYLFEVIFIDVPSPENILQLKKIIDEYEDEIICFIYEPLLQAAGGMLLYEAAIFDELLSEIKKKNIICIADEVMTGFYRTGKFFASDYLKNKADIICLSKGLTGGVMALGVTAATQKIFDAFMSNEHSKTFFHGHSFTANPIACAASLASLDLVEKENFEEQVRNIEKRNKEFFSFLTSRISSSGIRNPRTLGTMLAFEIASGNDGYLNAAGTTITQEALQSGIYLRPLGNTVYILPPYCITDEQLTMVYDFLCTIIKKPATG